MAAGNHQEKKQGIVPTELIVGRKLRDLRAGQGLSLRGLADRSGLNINTLSLIENGKSSPSVSTMHQLASALGIPIARFFETEPVEKKVVFTSMDKRPLTCVGSTRMHNLSKDLAGNAIGSFIVDLQPGMGSGDQMIVHTGHEFVFCLNGSVRYRIEQEDYVLKQGDSLSFEAHLPHRWENCGDQVAEILLVLFPADTRDEPGGRHFSIIT